MSRSVVLPKRSVWAPSSDRKAAIEVVAPVFLRTILQETRRKGFDPQSLCRGLGFLVSDLETPGFMVSHAEAATVLRRALAAINNPDLALELGMRGNITNLGVLALGLLASATLGEAMRVILRYPASAGLLVDLSEEVSGHEHGLKASARVEHQDIEPFVVDGVFTGLVRLCRQATGAAYSPLAVELTRSRPPDPRPYEAYFRSPVHFGAPRNRLVSDARWMDFVLPTANVMSARYAEVLLQREATQTAESAVGLAVARAVRQTLTHAPGSAEVASSLFLSERTMRRRLQASGQSFRKMQDEERKSCALALVTGGRVPLGQIALDTGFKDLSSFRRAFKRWTGRTPAEVRAQAGQRLETRAVAVPGMEPRPAGGPGPSAAEPR
jgi:AraC-like DNA-binding protein